MHDEVAGADERIDEMHPPVCQRTVELGLQNLFNAFHHETDDRLRGINDAVRIRNVNRKALEELFVDGVKKVLFLGEVLQIGGGSFDCVIKPVERFEEFACTGHSLH